MYCYFILLLVTAGYVVQPQPVETGLRAIRPSSSPIKRERLSRALETRSTRREQIPGTLEKKDIGFQDDPRHIKSQISNDGTKLSSSTYDVNRAGDKYIFNQPGAGAAIFGSKEIGDTLVSSALFTDKDGPKGEIGIKQKLGYGINVFTNDIADKGGLSSKSVGVSKDLGHGFKITGSTTAHIDPKDKNQSIYKNNLAVTKDFGNGAKKLKIEFHFK